MVCDACDACAWCGATQAQETANMRWPAAAVDRWNAVPTTCKVRTQMQFSPLALLADLGQLLLGQN